MHEDLTYDYNGLGVRVNNTWNINSVCYGYFGIDLPEGKLPEEPGNGHDWNWDNWDWGNNRWDYGDDDNNWAWGWNNFSSSNSQSGSYSSSSNSWSNASSSSSSWGNSGSSNNSWDNNNNSNNNSNNSNDNSWNNDNSNNNSNNNDSSSSTSSWDWNSTSRDWGWFGDSHYDWNDDEEDYDNDWSYSWRNGIGHGNGWDYIKPEPKQYSISKDYVVDYTSETFEVLTETEDIANGLVFTNVYGYDKISINIGTEVDKCQGEMIGIADVKLYTHMDRLGSQRFTTGEKGYTIGYTDYDEWGEMPSRLFMNFGLREVDVVKNYTGHEYDAILDVYYAKARFYDAGDRRFTQVDPIKGNIINPVSMTPYVYVVNNPLKYVDPLGLFWVEERKKTTESEKDLFLNPKGHTFDQGNGFYSEFCGVWARTPDTEWVVNWQGFGETVGKSLLQTILDQLLGTAQLGGFSNSAFNLIEHTIMGSGTSNMNLSPDDIEKVNNGGLTALIEGDIMGEFSDDLESLVNKTVLGFDPNGDPTAADVSISVFEEAVDILEKSGALSSNQLAKLKYVGMAISFANNMSKNWDIYKQDNILEKLLGYLDDMEIVGDTEAEVASKGLALLGYILGDENNDYFFEIICMYDVTRYYRDGYEVDGVLEQTMFETQSGFYDYDIKNNDDKKVTRERGNAYIGSQILNNNMFASIVSATHKHPELITNSYIDIEKHIENIRALVE